MITDWLEKLGLGQYSQRFVVNEVTLSIPPDLTDADLKELGVSALGHRRQLLRLPGQAALSESQTIRSTSHGSLDADQISALVTRAPGIRPAAPHEYATHS